MRSFNRIILGMVVLISPLLLSGQADNEVVTGVKYRIYSEVTGEEKEFWVHLPMHYEKRNNRYPVLYITDGDEHFQLASGTTEFMSSQFVIPEMLVVAMIHKDRNHDLTPTHCKTNLDGMESEGAKVSGGGEKFMQFMEKELIPLMEKNYRTGPYRIFAGHSLGGLLSVYAYLNYNHLFDAFLAMDPALTWDDLYCERMLANATYRSPNLSSKLYISSAHNAPYGRRDKSPFRMSQNSFCKALGKIQTGAVQHDYFENQNHLTVPYRSLYDGLAYVFSGFYILDAPHFELEIPFIQAFYEKQSKHYGIKFNPPERLIEMFGKYFLYDANDFQQSISFFEWNTGNYPSSSQAFKYLAKAYKATGNTEKALSSIRKACELDPENKEIRELWTELEEP